MPQGQVFIRKIGIIRKIRHDQPTTASSVLQKEDEHVIYLDLLGILFAHTLQPVPWQREASLAKSVSGTAG